ncbi:MAG: serine/threonine-protein kinase [Elainellaceae cyanobacterium]
MSESIALPNVEAHGYSIQRELGQNRLGGRYTYLARRRSSKNPARGAEPKASALENFNQNHSELGEPVVIKQFRFAQNLADWAGFQAHEAEVAILQQLNHPGIPHYLDAFETPDGFCMVQEYKDAPSLSQPRRWLPTDIKRVAIALLDILVYLQSRPDPVIHRDIKPENILVDQNLNVFLVDFGFARLGGEDLAASSMVKGTMGFMPPEQLFNRELTKASDLYSLGATLICLVTGTKSANIGNLILPDYRIRFRELVSPLHRGWLNWLEKLVEPRPENRHSSAKAALLELRSLDVHRVPKLKIDPQTLKFEASQQGDRLEQTVTLINSIPDTVLSGRWEVMPHASDPPHTPDAHPWIHVSPQYFEGNKVRCRIRVDTQRLELNRRFTRQICLYTNAVQESKPLTLTVKTASLSPPLPYRLMAIASLISFGLGLWFAFTPAFSMVFALVVIMPLFAGTDFALTWAATGAPIHLRNTLIKFFSRVFYGPFFGAFGGALALVLILLLLSSVAQLDGKIPAIINDFAQRIDAAERSLGISIFIGIGIGWLWALSGWAGRKQLPQHFAATRSNDKDIKGYIGLGLMILFYVFFFSFVAILFLPPSSLSHQLFLNESASTFMEAIIGEFIKSIVLPLGVCMVGLIILGHAAQGWLDTYPNLSGLASLPLLSAGWSMTLGIWVGLAIKAQQSSSAFSVFQPWVALLSLVPLLGIGTGLGLYIYHHYRRHWRYSQVKHQRIQP